MRGGVFLVAPALDGQDAYLLMAQPTIAHYGEKRRRLQARESLTTPPLPPDTITFKCMAHLAGPAWMAPRLALGKSRPAWYNGCARFTMYPARKLGKAGWSGPPGTAAGVTVTRPAGLRARRTGGGRRLACSVRRQVLSCERWLSCPW